LKPPLKPIEPDKDHECVDEDRRADHPHEVEDNLPDKSMSGVEF